MAEDEKPTEELGTNGEGLVAEPRPAYGPEIPQQKEFFKIPARFGHVPVAEEPLGYDKERRFEGHYPRIELPFQAVDVVKTGAERLGEATELFPQGRNRLFFGDCLHVMRMLPSESIDLIYIDPPFFSGRNYNLLFGDRNEVRSFTDIWDGGMPGYVIWLNARLYEMKRLLKPTGSIYVHLDWHAVHYMKCEMDKIFGYDNLRNEIIWKATNAHNDANRFGYIHQTLLFYSKGQKWTFNTQYQPYEKEYVERYYRYKEPDGRRFMSADLAGAGPGPARRFGDKLIEPPAGRHWAFDQEGIDKLIKDGRIFWTKNGIPRLKKYFDEMPGMPAQSLWTDEDVQYVVSWGPESIGYPTQKSEALLKRLIEATSHAGDVVADFFCGGGTTLAVAQKLGRRWLGCDISRVAVALTADRIARILAPSLDDLRRQKAKKIKKGEGLFEEIIENPTLTSVEDAKKKAVEASLYPRPVTPSSIGVSMR
jgi:DNA modification methylase